MSESVNADDQGILMTVAPHERTRIPTMATSRRLEDLKRAVWVALIPGAILFMALQTVGYARAGMIGVDSHAYWMAARFSETWYTRPPGYRDAFLYSPAFAQAVTVLIVAVSAALSPAAWLAWGQFVAHSAGQGGGPRTVRFAAAVGITIWAARTGRAWLLAPALILACPTLGGYNSVAVLAAIPRLLQFERTERAAKAIETAREKSRIPKVETSTA